MLKMNYSAYQHKTLRQIVKEAHRRGIPVSFNGEYKERDDLIGEIIAHDAYYEGRNDAMRSFPDKKPVKVVKVDVITDEREKYMLKEPEYSPVFLRLTPDQINFAKWCIDHDICFCDAILEKTEDRKWETP